MSAMSKGETEACLARSRRPCKTCDANGLHQLGWWFQYALPLCWLLLQRLGPVQDNVNRRGFGGAGTAEDQEAARGGGRGESENVGSGHGERLGLAELKRIG